MTLNGDTYRAVYTVKLAGASLRAACLSEEGDARHQHTPSTSWPSYVSDGDGQRHHARQRDPATGGGTSDQGTPRRKRATGIDDMPVTRGSGNVYADLGFANPGEELAKGTARGADRRSHPRARPHAAGGGTPPLGIDQPKVSHVLHGRLGGFSTQRLLDFLNALGRDVDIVVHAAPKSRKRGRLHVAAA